RRAHRRRVPAVALLEAAEPHHTERRRRDLRQRRKQIHAQGAQARGGLLGRDHDGRARGLAAPRWSLHRSAIRRRHFRARCAAVIAWLGEERAHNELLVGGKAAALSRLAASFRVPSGFVATPESDAAAIAAAYEALGQPRVAVRSPAVGEDGLEHSFAGQLETFLNIAGVDAVVDAVARCRASAESARVVDYMRARGVLRAAVSVLVQELVEA